MTVKILPINSEDATRNLEALRQNPYPGRIIVMGLNKAKTHVLQLYATMGRSESSRNRVFVADNKTGTLKTELADPIKETGDTSLLIYTAMTQGRLQHDTAVLVFAVSNGLQTEHALTYPLNEERFMSRWPYETDAPNFTPRITAVCTLHDKSVDFSLSIISKAPENSESELTYLEKMSMELFDGGEGICFHTYEGPGDPLPSFRREPYYIPFVGETTDDILQNFWETLNPDNRVSVAVKAIEIITGLSEIKVINKYEKVG